MQSPSDKRFRRSPEARVKHVGNAVAVYVPDRQAIHVLNQTARLIFELFEEPATEADICTALVEATDGEPGIIARDVSEAVADFLGRSILEIDA